MTFETMKAHYMSIINSHGLKGVERIEIGDSCFCNVRVLVITKLTQLKCLIIGRTSFYNQKKRVKGMKFTIRKCNQLSEIHIGVKSFFHFESFELKNLPSLVTLEIRSEAFNRCHSIIFDSIND